jgi:hypothetical protein
VHLINHDKTIMSHLYIFPTMHHIPMKPHRYHHDNSLIHLHHINDNSLIHLHLCILIKDNTYYITSIINQSITLTSINHLTSINQTIGINDNMIQHFIFMLPIPKGCDFLHPPSYMDSMVEFLTSQREDYMVMTH